MLEPRELVVPDTISKRTLKEMDQAVENFMMGNVSEAIDLSTSLLLQNTGTVPIITNKLQISS